jgi:hypothetical protein
MKEKMLKGCRIEAEILLRRGFGPGGKRLKRKAGTAAPIKTGAGSPHFFIYDFIEIFFEPGL